MTTKYYFSDDTWVDGDEDCPCCSGLTFEAYTLYCCEDENNNRYELFGIPIAMSIEDCYLQALSDSEDGTTEYTTLSWALVLYMDNPLEVLKSLAKDNKIEIIVN